MTKRLTIALVALALFVLVAVMPVSAAYYNVSKGINAGATVYIGEQGLNLTNAWTTAMTYYGHDPLGFPTTQCTDSTTIGWWASAAVLDTTSPSKSIDIATRVTSFTVAPSDFVGYAGNWYLVNPASSFACTPAIFTAADPILDIKIWDFTQNGDVTGKSVPQGELLGFKIETNMYNALAGNRYEVVLPPFDNPAAFEKNNFTGYIQIRVKDESGTTFTALENSSRVTKLLTKQAVDVQPYTWGHSGSVMDNWATGVMNAAYNQFIYPAGTYTVFAESFLNAMKDNYKNSGADYTGKTITETRTVTLVSDTVKITANKDSVVRSKPFSVTVTGRPLTMYHVWVKGTQTLDGSVDEQGPRIGLYQVDVLNDTWPEAAGYYYPTGAYQYQNGGGKNVKSAVGHDEYNGTLYYANITTSAAGTRTIEFVTNNWTKAQTFTIRVEQTFWQGMVGDYYYLTPGAQVKSDEVDVKVEKGAVTITAAGDQSYYLGEEVKFSGTNTESGKTYLFITGPNLMSQGSDIKSTDPRKNEVVDGNDAKFQVVDVMADNTWSWKWGTATVALDAGTYTIYAVAQPRDKNHLENTAYGTVSIIIKKPFVSATASQSTVAQGDRVFITGTAEGKPSPGVQIWILGKNYAKDTTESVNADASFSYEVKREFTKDLAAGQYFVVVQHPMQNDQFDIVTDTTTTAETWVKNLMLNKAGETAGTRLFRIEGAGSLQGTDAAEALVQGINDPNVDDTYTKLAFLVENPVIRIDAIGDRHVGDKFTITATTNLAVDDEVLFEVYSSSFKPTQKSQSGEFSGATGTIKVIKGESGLNKLTFDVDASTFKPDEYIVKAEAVLQDATGTALFNVLESAAPTAVPTAVKTAVAPVVTTAAPTTVATPTKTPTQPGFGALVALIGLGAVAFLVVRKH